MAKETAAERLQGKRRPRDPGPDRDEEPRDTPDTDDRTRAHHRHGGSAT
jgi:hypothetical protein